MRTLAHNDSSSHRARAGWFLRCGAALGALALVSPLMAATQAEQAAAERARSSGTPEQVYRQYRADCLAGRTHQDRATCLREANHALDASRKGQLSNPGAAATDNATQRCAAFPTAAEQTECVRRIQNSQASG